MTRAWKELGRYGGVGIELVLAILILSAIGHWFDARYGKGHDWGMTVGFFLGIAVGVRNLVRVAKQMQRDIEKAEAEDPAASRWTVDEDWIARTPEQSEGPGANQAVARAPEHTNDKAVESHEPDNESSNDPRP